MISIRDHSFHLDFTWSVYVMEKHVPNVLYSVYFPEITVFSLAALYGLTGCVMRVWVGGVV